MCPHTACHAATQMAGSDWGSTGCSGSGLFRPDFAKDAKDASDLPEKPWRGRTLWGRMPSSADPPSWWHTAAQEVRLVQLGACCSGPLSSSQGGCALPAPRGRMQVGYPGCMSCGPHVRGTMLGWKEGGSAGGLAAPLPCPSTTGMQQSATHPLGELGADLPTATLPANGPSKGW